MNEMMINQKDMYDEVAEIQNLNKVDGFDPRRYMRVIQSEGEPSKFYLDVAFRKLWFRLKYPEGKIVKKILKLTEQVAIVEAKVYLNRHDSEGDFISNALAQKYFSTDVQFGNKYVELAETAAVGRALSDAGFGLQFADREGELDPQVTEAPMEAKMLFPDEGTYGSIYMDDGGEIIDHVDIGEQEFDDHLPGQYGIDEYLPMTEGGSAMIETMSGTTPAMQQGVDQTANVATPPAMQQAPKQQMQQGNQIPATAQQQTPVQHNAEQVSHKQAQTGIKKDMPVEQIYALLNRESAAAVVISAGYHKGKTLGQLAVEKPKSLEWYVSSYAGPDNLLRTAAKFLLDSALNQAS